jgi:hypothetical protein
VVSHILLCALLILSSAECKLTQECTQVLEMDSLRLTHLKELRDSPSDGYQLLSDTHAKDSVNSVSMKSSRMFTETPLARMSLSIEPSVSPSLQLAPSSLLISFSAQWKQSKLECKLPPQELVLEVELRPSEPFKLLRDRLVFTEVSSHYG